MLRATASEGSKEIMSDLATLSGNLSGYKREVKITSSLAAARVRAMGTSMTMTFSRYKWYINETKFRCPKSFSSGVYTVSLPGFQLDDFNICNKINQIALSLIIPRLQMESGRLGLRPQLCFRDAGMSGTSL